MKHYYKLISLIFTLVFALVISGCAGTTSALTNRDLNVTTKTSSSVFLDPVAPNKRVVYVQIRNTSGYSTLGNIQPQIESSIRQRGYKITDNPDKAHFILQANVLQAGEIKAGSQNGLLSGGFGGALQGAALGAGVGALVSTHSAGGALGGALAGAAVGAAVNTLWQDQAYAVTTDVQISQRTKHANKVQSASTLKQGDSGSSQISSTKSSNWQRYQTRIVSSAEKVNLKFQEAEPALAQGTANSIAGMF